MNILLDRYQFNLGCLTRDNYSCVFCKSKETPTVHHILERQLFPLEQQYILNNGVTLCPVCHWLAETTDISVEELRNKIGVRIPVLPEDFDPKEIYDKWGNIILPNKNRIKGPLFEDKGCQLTLQNKLSLFIDYVKYPRTYHLPYSPSVQNDDRQLPDDSCFKDKLVVVTEKLDGESTSLYYDYYHARSINITHHSSRDWVKAFHGSIKDDIPKGWRICGENVFALHTIPYSDLSTYFYGYSIWDDKNNCLSWGDTLDWFDLLGIAPAPLIYQGTYDKDSIVGLYEDHPGPIEGFVVRNFAQFPYRSFSTNVAKYVSKQFKQTLAVADDFWRNRPVIPNKLKKP